VGSTIAQYEPEVIEQFAAKLYRKASTMLFGSTVLGIALGAAFGGVPLTSLGEAWPISRAFGFATLLLGALAGAVIGHVIGEARAFGYRLQAQSALCQLEHERSSAATAAAVEDLIAAIGQLIVAGPLAAPAPPPHVENGHSPAVPPLSLVPQP